MAFNGLQSLRRRSSPSVLTEADLYAVVDIASAVGNDSEYDMEQFYYEVFSQRDVFMLFHTRRIF